MCGESSRESSNSGQAVNRQLVPLAEIPNSIHEDVVAQIGCYSVAFARCRNHDLATFRFVGSGTCVRRNGVFGVLTAHHCLHAVYPEITLGGAASEELWFVLNNGRAVLVAPDELVEHPIGAPREGSYGPEGPDLTFIEIPTGPRLSSVTAVNSFVPLDRTPDDIIRRYCVGMPYITNVGFPAERQSQRIIQAREQVSVDMTLMSYFSSLDQSRIATRENWDYIRAVCDRRVGGDLPTSFGGLSGGGIWVVDLHRDHVGNFSVRDFRFVGVSFYEEEIDVNRRAIVGHYVRSVYSTAWVGWSGRRSSHHGSGR